MKPKILRHLAEQRPRRAAMMIRHAERYQIISVLDSLGVGLTDKGMKDARDYGGAIPDYDMVRVFHSPALRCRQTAEQIVLGMQDKGVDCRLVGEDENLCAPYVKDEDCLRAADRLGNAFLRTWFEGGINEAWIHPPALAADMVLRSIVPRLVDVKNEGLDIHVSHDWDIMLVREQLLGLRLEEVGWLGFLDGLLFSKSATGFKACYDGRSNRFDWVEGRSIKGT